MKDAAIVIGHTRDSQGVCSPFGIRSEWLYNKCVVGFLTDIADIFEYGSYSNGYTAMVKANAAKINKGDYKLVIELHYNASAPEANGCEALYYHDSTAGKELAEKASTLISSKMGVNNRGIKPLDKTKRGYAAVYYPEPPAIILEPFFGTNKNDVAKFNGKEREYAAVIRKLIELSCAI